MPLHFISEMRAMILLLKEKAEVMDMGDRKSLWEGNIIASPSRTFVLPATIRLVKGVKCVWRPTRFRKAVLFERDRMTCQYCGVHLRRDSVTIDHVLPKSRGGVTSWENCVTACHKCNKKKADCLPTEAGMRLLHKPTAPKLRMWNVGTWHEDWSSFVHRDA
jgi:5-methylcytosine-specific restriction endonuclease McrA